MIEEVFLAVREAEERAEASMQQARMDARDILKEAESVAVENERDAARENRLLFQKILEQKREEVQLTLDKQNAESIDLLNKRLDAYRQRFPQAISFIEERVIGHGHC